MTTTALQTPLDAGEVERFAGTLFEAGLATLEVVNAALGLRLGLYDALSAGPATPAGLAARAGADVRYVREWLEQQAAAGVVELEDRDEDQDDDDERTFRLPAEHAHVLLDRDAEAYTGALVEGCAVAATWLPLLEPAYRTGAGVPYGDFGVHDLQAGFSRPVFANHLVQEWLPALPEAHARLAAGTARVAEMGCGEGHAAVLLATSFPGVRVDGFDLDDASVAAARRAAVDAGVADRVRFEVADAVDVRGTGRYDLVACFEVLHDASDPVGLLAAMRALRADGGTVLVVDERVAEHLALPTDPVERLLYAFSTLHCLPAGRAQQPSAATGAVMRPATLRRYAADAGFTGVEDLPVEHPQFRLSVLHG